MKGRRNAGNSSEIALKCKRSTAIDFVLANQANKCVFRPGDFVVLGGRELLIFFRTRVWAVWVEERAGSPFGTADSRYPLIATEGDAACTCKFASLPSASSQNVSVPCTQRFNCNSHREDAKNAKKAVGELVDFLFRSRSRRLGGEPLNLRDLLRSRAVSSGSGTSARPCMQRFNCNFHREDAKNAKKAMGELVDFLFPSRSWRLGAEPLNLRDLLRSRAVSCGSGTSARPCMQRFNCSFHREDAKNAKKAMGELVDFLFPSRSWRLGGEPLNLLDLLLASGLVRVRAALPPVSVVPELPRPLHSMASTPIFTAKSPRTPRKRWVNLLISSSVRALGVLAVSH
jgi:hypothetical protein